MIQKPDFQIGLETGAAIDDDKSVILFDIRGYSPIRKAVITENEFVELVKKFRDGLCAVCFMDISGDDIVCCNCADEIYKLHKTNCICEIGR